MLNKSIIHWNLNVRYSLNVNCVTYLLLNGFKYIHFVLNFSISSVDVAWLISDVIHVYRIECDKQPIVYMSYTTSYLKIVKIVKLQNIPHIQMKVSVDWHLKSMNFIEQRHHDMTSIDCLSC